MVIYLRADDPRGSAIGSADDLLSTLGARDFRIGVINGTATADPRLNAWTIRRMPGTFRLPTMTTKISAT